VNLPVQLLNSSPQHFPGAPKGTLANLSRDSPSPRERKKEKEKRRKRKRKEEERERGRGKEEKGRKSP